MTAGARGAGVLAIVALGCAERDPVALAELVPPHGPLVGGTVITIHGRGFESAPPGETRVLIGGREAPLVATLDDGRLEVATPPGTRPGATDVVVVVGDHAARAAAAFRYSAPPTIAAVTPAEVLHDASTRITVSGSGFLDEDAGTTVLLVDGQAAPFEVVDDTTLAFFAPGGRPFLEPDLYLVNQRGRATHARAFRYLPSTSPGLLLFSQQGTFATYFDPRTEETVDVPFAGFGINALTAVVLDASGDYWAFDRGRNIGRLDLNQQDVDGRTFVGHTYPAATRVGETYYAIDRDLRRVGRVTVPDGVFAPLPDVPPFCCRGSFGLASDGTSLFAVGRTGKGEASLTIIDLASGLPGAPRPIEGVPGLHVEELHHYDGTLYAASRDGHLLTIDPVTATATATLPFAISRVRAIARYEP